LLEASLEVERTKRTEVEKEQEDLLVLLDELSNKRAKDKQRMKEKGMEVSEDENDDEEDEDEEDED
jgi:intracellular protein transport protein USO1